VTGSFSDAERRAVERFERSFSRSTACASTSPGFRPSASSIPSWTPPARPAADSASDCERSETGLATMPPAANSTKSNNVSDRRFSIPAPCGDLVRLLLGKEELRPDSLHQTLEALAVSHASLSQLVITAVRQERGRVRPVNFSASGGKVDGSNPAPS